MEEKPFANDWYLASEILRLKKLHKIRTIIETGTWKGNTTKFLSDAFDSVITIELDTNFYEEAKWLDEHKNVRRLKGSSQYWLDRLADILKKEKVIIFLDAHGFGMGCPLHKELDALIKNKWDNVILIVHDCYNPEEPSFGFDVYDGVPISYDLLKDKLEELYGREYAWYYNMKAVGERRGVLFTISNKV